MSLNNACSALSGLFHSKSSKEWIVTPKLGCQNENICSATKSTGKELLKLKRNNNVLDTLNKKNRNQSYFNRLSLCKHLINDYLQRIYNRMHQKLLSFRIDKGNFCMPLYLVMTSYIAFQKTAYFISIYFFSTAIMCFILAFGYMGRQIQQVHHIL